jgi:beta-glucosidase-like glycosyl hydrolase
MQEDVEKHIALLNEFQGKSKIKMMIGIDGEWGLFQRFVAHKFPWAMTLGAIQNNNLIYEMTSKIAEDCKEWAFIGISRPLLMLIPTCKSYYWQQKFWF